MLHSCNTPEKIAENFLELVNIMDRLRSETGCPWDREQTHASLKRYLLEESHELFDAIDSDDPQEVCEELGDLLLQPVFHAQIAKEAGRFDIADCLKSISNKLRHRHPHVFGDEKAANPDEVMVIWQRQKSAEGKKNKDHSLLSNVPKSLPSLAKAQELQRKVSKVGFDWPEIGGPLEKVAEELEELNQAIKEGGSEADREEEMGDLLFALSNVCRHLGFEAEEALRKANRKFEKRFREVERLASESDNNLQEMSLEEMDTLWNEVKKMDGPAKS